MSSLEEAWWSSVGWLQWRGEGRNLMHISERLDGGRRPVGRKSGTSGKAS